VATAGTTSPRPQSAADLGCLLLEPEGIRDPFPIYRRLREASPVYWSDALDGWVVTGYPQVRECYRDHERFANGQRSLRRFGGFLAEAGSQVPNVELTLVGPGLSQADPPVHTHQRAWVSRGLSPRSIARRAEWTADVCERLADSLAEQEHPDLIEHFTKPLAYEVILDLFGVPIEFAELFDRASRAYFEFENHAGVTLEAALAYERVLVELRTALEALYPELKARNDDSIISSLLQPHGGAELDTDELFLILKNFFTAGQDNLVFTVAVAMLELLRRPEQLDLLRREPELAVNAFEETVRWDPPVPANTRLAAVDTEFEGGQICQGDILLVVKAAANRDPAFWTNPEEFDITRDTNEPPSGSISFGQGIHFCVGAGLARQVGPRGIETLARRFPTMRLADGWTPEWRPLPLRRKLNDVRVELH
jgi:cytochrome P450